MAGGVLRERLLRARPHLVRLAGVDQRLADVVEQRRRQVRARLEQRVRLDHRVRVGGLAGVGRPALGRAGGLVPVVIALPGPGQIILRAGRRSLSALGAPARQGGRRGAEVGAAGRFGRLRARAGRDAGATAVRAGRDAGPTGVHAAGRCEHLAQREHQRLGHLADGALRGGVVLADRLDGVADEVEAQGALAAHGEHVDDAAAHAELAVLVHRVLACEAGLDQSRGQPPGVDLVACLEGDGGRQQPAGSAQPRQQRGGRGDNHAGGAGGGRVQRARASRHHAHVRREAAVGINLVRGQRQHRVLHRALRQPLDRGQEEADVRGHLLGVPVGRDDGDDGAAAGAGTGGGSVAGGDARKVERLGRGREAARARNALLAEVGPGDGGLQERLERERGRHEQIIVTGSGLRAQGSGAGSGLKAQGSDQAPGSCGRAGP